MKTLVCFLLSFGWLILALSIWWVACTAPVNVNVRAEQWQCPAEIHNQDGTVDFKGCSKVDGEQPTDQDATDGADTLEVSAVADPRLN